MIKFLHGADWVNINTYSPYEKAVMNDGMLLQLYAVNIDNEQITEWINSCIESVKKQLENNVESPYAFRASGDTIVICFYSQDIDDNVFDDNNYFSVIVAKNYESADFFI